MFLSYPKMVNLVNRQSTGIWDPLGILDIIGGKKEKLTFFKNITYNAETSDD